MKTEQPILVTTVKAAAELTKNYFVAFDGTVATASAKALGVCNADSALNEQAPITCRGIAVVKTSAAISLGAPVYSDASGLAASSGTYIEGYALDAASGSDELIRVLLV